MGEPENPYFYDFWIFGRVPGSQNQLCLSLETPGYLSKPNENTWSILRIFFANLKMSEHPTCWKCSKRRAPGNNEDPLNQILKSLDMILISIKNMGWKFGNMVPTSFENIKGFLNLRNQENKQPGNFETKKPKTTKTRSQEALLFSSQGIP